MARPSFALPPLVALAGWLLPGAGYLMIGEKVRGFVIMITILLMFAVGILIAGIRVIDVPGYDSLGRAVRVAANGQKIDPNTNAYATGTWALKAQPVNQIVNKPWYVGQVLTGPVCLVASNLSLWAAEPQAPGSSVSRVPSSHARIAEIGSLYTAIAGMLNLLAMMDSASRAGRIEASE